MHLHINGVSKGGKMGGGGFGIVLLTEKEMLVCNIPPPPPCFLTLSENPVI